MGGFSVVDKLLLVESAVLVKEDKVVSSVGPATVEGAGEEDLVAVGVIAEFVARMVETADVMKDKKLLETGIDCACDCGCGWCCCGSVVVGVVIVVIEVSTAALVRIPVFTVVGVAVVVVVAVVSAAAAVVVDSDFFLWWWVIEEKR